MTMQRKITYTLLIALFLSAIACKSDRVQAQVVIDAAMQMDHPQKNFTNEKSEEPSMQNATQSDPVKKEPTQEELIKQYKVKTVKETYPTGWAISTYDRNGILVATETDYWAKRTYNYTYDQNGNVIEEKSKSEDGITWLIKYTYDEKNRRLSRSFTSSDGLDGVEEYAFDDVLNIRTESSSSGMEKEFYDNRGLCVKIETYDEKGELISAGESKYDADGLKISEDFSILRMQMHDVFEYNENAQVLKQHRTGGMNVDFLFEYDEKGLMTKYKKVKDNEEEVTTYAYTFY